MSDEGKKAPSEPRSKEASPKASEPCSPKAPDDAIVESVHKATPKSVVETEPTADVKPAQKAPKKIAKEPPKKIAKKSSTLDSSDELLKKPAAQAPKGAEKKGAPKKAPLVFNKKLRNRMLVRVLATAAAVLMALTFATFYFTRSLLVAQLEAKSLSKVGLAAASIDAWLHDKGEMVSVMARRAAMSPLPEAERKRFYRGMCKEYGCNESLYMAFEKDGSFFTGANWTPPKGYDPRKRPWYVKTKKAGHTVFTTPYLDPYTKKIVVTVVAPMKKDGRFLGVLAMDVFIDDILAKVRSLRIGKTSFAYLVDGDGLFVSHPQKEKVLKERIASTADAAFFRRFKGAREKAKAKNGADESGLFRKTELYSGKDDYVTIARIDESGWYLVFHMSKTEVYEPLKKLLSIFGGGILASLLLLAFTISYISHRIAHPILDLAQGARFIAEGDYDRRLQVQSRDEIGYLTKSFNDMAEGLKDRDFIKSTFGRYVSEDVMQDILDGNISLGGEKKRITILFSDIRGFTSLSEGMDAGDVVTLLNEYFDAMDTTISAQGGSINKYIGDGILAIYGAPHKLENSSRAAVESATEMLEQLAQLNEKRSLGLRIGVGVHTGEAVVGNIGSLDRTEYTVIGDAVNLASRIESLTKQYRREILISEDSAKALGDHYLLRIIDKVRVKGKRIPVTLYSPHRRSETSKDGQRLIQKANEAMERYFRGEFPQALEAIQKMQEDGLSLDAHLQLIQKRCETYVETPPKRWDGVFTHKTK